MQRRYGINAVIVVCSWTKVSERLLKSYSKNGSVRVHCFAAALKLDLSGLQQTYDVRPFTMQLNESDYDF